MPKIPAAVRAWIYGVAVVVAPLLVAYNVASTEEVALWLNVVGAVLLVGANGLALANVTPDDQR